MPVPEPPVLPPPVLTPLNLRFRAFRFYAVVAVVAVVAAAPVAALAADLFAVPALPVHKRAQPHPPAVHAGHEPFHCLPVLLLYVASLPVVPRRPAVRHDYRFHHLAVSPPAASRLLHEIHEPVRLLHVYHRHDPLNIDPRPQPRRRRDLPAPSFFALLFGPPPQYLLPPAFPRRRPYHLVLDRRLARRYRRNPVPDVLLNRRRPYDAGVPGHHLLPEPPFQAYRQRRRQQYYRPVETVQPFQRRQPFPVTGVHDNRVTLVDKDAPQQPPRPQAVGVRHKFVTSGQIRVNYHEPRFPQRLVPSRPRYQLLPDAVDPERLRPFDQIRYIVRNVDGQVLMPKPADLPVVGDYLRLQLPGKPDIQRVMLLRDRATVRRLQIPDIFHLVPFPCFPGRRIFVPVLAPAAAARLAVRRLPAVVCPHIDFELPYHQTADLTAQLDGDVPVVRYRQLHADVPARRRRQLLT
ncbi:hypothetical protein DL771_011221 [Monosporascus sp. 5C6A]|nr:hypothetical protein DL771_011221 [Monosporascus sp. 5C6A]